MEVFSRLALGTSNWNEQRPYGHRGVTCPREEQEKIVAYCMSAGIHTIHTKKAYGVNLSWVPTAFDIWYSDEFPCCTIYDPADPVAYRAWSVLQVPYSPFDRRHEEHFENYKVHVKELHVRSCFVQSKVFASDEPVFVRFRKYAGELGIPVGTLCILFCLLNPHVDKVIIGVDSEQQLRDNLRFFHRIDGFGVDDPKVIDPRIFTKGA